MAYVTIQLPRSPRYVVRPCDEPDGSRTWDVLEITSGERDAFDVEITSALAARAPGAP